jgi:hypothetical protein
MFSTPSLGAKYQEQAQPEPLVDPSQSSYPAQRHIQICTRHGQLMQISSLLTQVHLQRQNKLSS